MNSTKQSIYVHERPITDLKFHNDGDVFFSSSKDTCASMIRLDGSVLGSFEKHLGAISSIGCYDNSLITAGMDLILIGWDILNGTAVAEVPIDSVVRGIDCIDQTIYFCTDDSMSKEPIAGIYDQRTSKITKILGLNDPSTKIFKCGENLIISSANGTICKLDLRMNQIVQEAKVHQARVTNMKPSACRSFFITASTDASSKILDSDSFAIKKRFDCEEPINCAALFHTNDKAICAGGINARDVTTTKGKGTFDTNFFDIVTQQKIGSFNTHFGTINSLDIHPKSTHYISGGEDGSVCLVKFGDDFNSAPFTDFN